MTEEVSHRAQVAALPVRGKVGAYEVLLITTRDTGRWIIPKGWPMKGRKDHEAAAQEALEEAGVTGRVTSTQWAPTPTPSGRPKAKSPIRVMVYLLEVENESGKWPEKGQRRREWCSTKEAAERVDEVGLTEILGRLDVTPLDAARA